MGSLLLLMVLTAVAVVDVEGLAAKAKAEIAINHNKFRAKVSPTAANMLNMTWYEPASKTAQFWASSCKRLQHDDNASRKDSKFGACGQNIFISSGQVSWATAIKAWHSEVSEFTYGSDLNALHATGHYTQMVWALTHKVGCGFAKCLDAQGVFYNYVCNYCPAGNIVGSINTPYKTGEQCSGCPYTCLANKLCPAKAASVTKSPQLASKRLLNALIPSLTKGLLELAVPGVRTYY